MAGKLTLVGHIQVLKLAGGNCAYTVLFSALSGDRFLEQRDCCFVLPDSCCLPQHQQSHSRGRFAGTAVTFWRSHRAQRPLHIGCLTCGPNQSPLRPASRCLSSASVSGSCRDQSHRSRSGWRENGRISGMMSIFTCACCWGKWDLDQCD